MKSKKKYRNFFKKFQLCFYTSFIIIASFHFHTYNIDNGELRISANNANSEIFIDPFYINNKCVLVNFVNTNYVNVTFIEVDISPFAETKLIQSKSTCKLESNKFFISLLRAPPYYS